MAVVGLTLMGISWTRVSTYEAITFGVGVFRGLFLLEALALA